MDRLSESSRVLEPSRGVLQFKLPRTDSSIYGVDVVQNNFKKKQACSNIVGQYNGGSFCEQIRWSFNRTGLFSSRYPFDGHRKQNNLTGSLSVRGRQLESRPVVENEFNVRVDASSKYVSTLRSQVGTSSCRLLCFVHDHSEKIKISCERPFIINHVILLSNEKRFNKKMKNVPFSVCVKRHQKFFFYRT